MFWGDFPKEMRMAEQERFKPPTFRRYQRPAAKYVVKGKNGPVFLITKCNDCPFEKVSQKTCKRCRCQRRPRRL